MAWAEINGLRMFYESHGEGDPVVFAHGAGGSHLSWWQEVAHFRTTHRCISFDHRGFGQTTVVGEAASTHYAEDLRALLDHLEIDRAVLVAQSMGGTTCMGFTAAWPERVRALVMADTMLGMTDDGIRERMAAARQPGAPMGLQGRTYATSLRERRPDLAFLYDSIMATNPPRQAPAGGAAPRSPDPRFNADAARLKELGAAVPMLFVVGDEDAIFPRDVIEYAASLVPGAKFVVVPGSGHSVYFEDAPAFNRILGGFLASL